MDGNYVGACMKSTLIVPGWPTGPEGKYEVWADERTIPAAENGENCELILYREMPTGTGSGQNFCATFYRRIPTGEICTTVTLEPEFGYA